MGEAMDSFAVDPWVERAQAGDTGAFEEIYRQHVGRVYALCLRMSGDPGEATELTQDAFVRAWEKLDTFHGSSAFSSWLHRLTVNVVLGRWRARGRQRERVVAIDEVVAGGGGRDPLQVPERRDAIDLERAIAALPTGARTVFVLHDVEGYGHKEIAEMTGLATGTSKAQLHRARRLLREALG
ncbi:MAG: RNA polymerase sigma factor [bacterium]|nr:RNA polymerase sigma factor [bacterium]